MIENESLGKPKHIYGALFGCPKVVNEFDKNTSNNDTSDPTFCKFSRLYSK